MTSSRELPGRDDTLRKFLILTNSKRAETANVNFLDSEEWGYCARLCTWVWAV